MLVHETMFSGDPQEVNFSFRKKSKEDVESGSDAVEITNEYGRTVSEVSEGDATMEVIERGYKRIRVISFEQNDSAYALKFLQQTLSEMEDPSKCLFLVEECTDSDVMASTEVFRSAVASAQERGIVVEDPIIPPYNSELLDLYITSIGSLHFNYSRRKLAQEFPAKDIMVGAIARRYKRHATYPSVAEVSNALKMPAEEIARGIDSYKSERVSSILFPAEFDDLADAELGNLDLYATSVSARALDYLLEKYPDKPEVVLCVGFPMASIARGGPPRFHEESSRLGDAQVESLLVNRDAATSLYEKGHENVKPRSLEDTRERIRESERGLDLPDDAQRFLYDNAGVFSFVEVHRNDINFQEMAESDFASEYLYGVIGVLATSEISSADDLDSEVRSTVSTAIQQRADELWSRFEKLSDVQWQMPNYLELQAKMQRSSDYIAMNALAYFSQNVDVLAEVTKRYFDSSKSEPVASDTDVAVTTIV